MASMTAIFEKAEQVSGLSINLLDHRRLGAINFILYGFERGKGTAMFQLLSALRKEQKRTRSVDPQAFGRRV